MKNFTKLSSLLILLFLIIPLSPTFLTSIIHEITKNIHQPIVIVGDNNFTANNGVVGGNGTKENPYIISGWVFEGVDTAITVENTNAYFVIKNCTIRNSTTGIRFQNVKNASVELIDIMNTTYPTICFYTSANFSRTSFINFYQINYGNSFISMDKCNFSEGRYGIFLQDVSNLSISNCTFFRIQTGLEISNPSSVTIRNSNFEECNYSLYIINNGKVFINNSIIQNCEYGVKAENSQLYFSYDVIKNNKFGVELINMDNCFIENTTFVNNSILPTGKSLQNIEIINSTVNGKRIVYLKDKTQNLEGDLGEVLAYNSTIIIKNGNSSNADVFIAGEKSVIFVQNYTIIKFRKAVFLDRCRIFINKSYIKNCLTAGDIKNSEIYFESIVVENNTQYLYVENSTGYVRNSTFLYNEDVALWLENCRNLTIHNNTFLNNIIGGIMLNFCGNCTISNNTFVGCGIYLHGGENARWSYTTNIFSNNTVNNKNLIFYYKRSNLNIGDAGEVIVVECENITFSEGNYSNTDVGVQVLFSNNITFVNTSATHNGWHGLYVCFSQNITFFNCSATKNRWAGFYLYSDENVSIYNCTSHENHVGFLVYNTNLFVNASSIEKNYFGMEIDSSENSTITQSIFKYNENYAIKLDECKNFLIYKNYFFGNRGSGTIFDKYKVQAYDNGRNKWNLSVGNYWADWANNNGSNDQNNDGIVDYPYPIDGGSYDYLPLKGAPVVYELNGHQISLYTLLLIISLWKSRTLRLRSTQKRKRQNYQQKGRYQRI